MSQNFKEQLPAALLTTLLTVVLLAGYTFWIRQEVVNDISQRQQAEMTALREETHAELISSTSQLREEIAATHALLKEAVARRDGDLFLSDQEVAEVNQQKVAELTEALAARLGSGSALSRTPEEAAQLQETNMEQVSSRIASKVHPILQEIAQGQDLTQDKLDAYSREISNQISSVLTSELAAKQQLNNNLLTTASIARDSLRLSQELTALYLSDLKDQSLLGRLLTLPAKVVQDTANLSIVSNSDRKDVEARLATEMQTLQDRLENIESQMPK